MVTPTLEGQKVREWVLEGSKGATSVEEQMTNRYIKASVTTHSLTNHSAPILAAYQS